MKRKMFIILFFVFLFLLFLFVVLDDRYDDEEVKTDKKVDVVYETDLFGNYYKQASKIVNQMSLEEKVGQLFLVRYDSNLVLDHIHNYYPGGYLFFAKDFEQESKTSFREKIKNYQMLSKIPLIIAVDEEGGFVTRVSRFKNFREEKFLSPREYYNQGGYDLLKEREMEKANLLLNLGINLNLAPVADVSVDQGDYIYNRSFGLDAHSTSQFIENMVSYAKEAGISSCLKHFPGYGNNVDTHTGVSIDKRSYDVFEKSDFLPFQSGIEAEVPAILMSHNVVVSIDKEHPASLSKKMHKILREDLSFSGIIITDDLAMGAVKSYIDDKKSATLAVHAGNDFIITSDFSTMYFEVLESVKSGEIDIKTIDKAVKRVIAWKYAYGLF